MNNAQHIVDSIQTSFDETFPNGWSNMRVVDVIGKCIYITFGLVPEDKIPNNIKENDPVFHNFVIHIEGEDLFEAAVSSSGIFINPPENSYLAMGRVKTKFRKTTGDSKRIIKTFNTFFGRLKILVAENESNIFGRDKYPSECFK